MIWMNSKFEMIWPAKSWWDQISWKESGLKELIHFWLTTINHSAQTRFTLNPRLINRLIVGNHAKYTPHGLNHTNTKSTTSGFPRIFSWFEALYDKLNHPWNFNHSLNWQIFGLPQRELEDLRPYRAKGAGNYGSLFFDIFALK